MSKIPFRFAPVPDDMIFDGAAPSQVVHLYAVLYRLWDLAGGTVAISQVELGKRLCWSDDTVARWSKKAQELGWIHVRRRGQGLPNEYHPVWPEPADLQDQTAPEPAELRTTSADLRDQSSISRSRERNKTRVGFADWYEAYPLHKARGDAEKAWRQMNGDTPDLAVLLSATREYARSDAVKRGFAKYPGTWLRSKCWLDEEEHRNGDGPSLPICPSCHAGWAEGGTCFSKTCPMLTKELA